MNVPFTRGREIVLALFVAIAWMAIVRPGPVSLPYFWDEADVYVPGSKWVTEHGLNVTPGVFPDDYSRGHPPLLYLLAGFAFRLFGPAPAVGHLLVLPFAIAALVGTYWIGVTLWDRRVGVAAALLLGTTPLFMTMGNMLLPEMPLTALTVLAFLALARGRLWVATACGVALVLIKETGVFSVAAITATVLWDAHSRGVLKKSATWKRFGIAASPVAALCGFFLWQKIHAGYFIFPHHQDLFAERPLRLNNLWTVFPSLFLWHGRLILVLVALVTWWRARSRSHPPLSREATPRWIPTRGAMIAGFVALVLCNATFFAKMFWLERYALPAHPGFLLGACGTLFAAADRWTPRPHVRGGPWLAVAAVVALGLVGLYSSTRPNSEEQSFAYADVIATHRAAFRAIDRAESVLTSWPMTIELREPYLGYVAHPVTAIHVDSIRDHPDIEIAIVIVNPHSNHAAALRQEARRRGLLTRRVHQIGQGPPLEVYR